MPLLLSAEVDLLLRVNLSILMALDSSHSVEASHLLFCPRSRLSAAAPLADSQSQSRAEKAISSLEHT